MILSLQGPKKTFHFAIKGSFETSYTINLETHLKKEASRTHPGVVTWSGSEIDDIPVTLFLAVAALKDDPIVTQIETPQKLIEVVEELHNWALPPNQGDNYLQSIGVYVGGVNGADGRGWFYRTALIKSIKVEWKEPWDIQTGMPMVAEVKMVLKVFIGNATFPDSKGAVGFKSNFRPHRPWKFDRMWS